MIFTHGDNSIFYTVSGSGSPLVLLHGNGGTHAMFDDAVKALESSYTVYAIDAPGHGESAGRSSLNYYDMAENIAEFMTALRLRGAGFVGYSDGAIIGLIIAYRHKNLIGSLISCGANSYPRGVISSCWKDVQREAAKSKNIYAMLMLSKFCIKKRQLGKIQSKVTVLAGEHDLIKRRNTLFIHRNIKNSRLEILRGEDHGSYVYDAKKLVALVEKYL